jgi:hypothetical protein
LKSSAIATTTHSPIESSQNNLQKSLTLLSGQSGKLEQKIQNLGTVSLNILKDTNKQQITFFIDSVVRQIDLASSSFNGISNNNGKGTIFRVYAKDDKGALVHNFEKNIIITLPIPAELQGKNIRVFEREESSTIWKKIKIQKIANDTVEISTKNLSYFMVTSSKNNFTLSSLLKKYW